MFFFKWDTYTHHTSAVKGELSTAPSSCALVIKCNGGQSLCWPSFANDNNQIHATTTK